VILHRVERFSFGPTKVAATLRDLDGKSGTVDNNVETVKRRVETVEAKIDQITALLTIETKGRVIASREPDEGE
jgi:hypothetical protein